jgi:hypothetical protein
MAVQAFCWFVNYSCRSALSDKLNSTHLVILRACEMCGISICLAADHSFYGFLMPNDSNTFTVETTILFTSIAIANEAIERPTFDMNSMKSCKDASSTFESISPIAHVISRYDMLRRRTACPKRWQSVPLAFSHSR